MSSRMWLTCWGVLLVVGGAFAQEQAQVTYESLLREMVDREAIARFPAPAYKCSQASSYDCKSDAGPTSSEWFANADRGQYIREEVNAGRREWVMLDVTGAGAVVRFWSANPSDDCIVRFYFDGSAEPALEVPFTDLLGGTWRVGEPLSAVRARGWNLYLPIPFGKGCKITSDKEDYYYQINYRIYEPGTTVETFSTAVFDRGRSVLRNVVHQLNSGSRTANAGTGRPVEMSGELQSVATASMDLPAGEHVIRSLMVSLDGADPEQIFRQTVIRIEFDGEETVWCPVGDFFGSGVGVNPYISWWQVIGPNNEMRCFWPMPYEKSAKITLESVGSAKRKYKLEAQVGDWKWDERSMHFNTAWRHEYPISTAQKQDWNYVEIEGQGVFVGDLLALMNPTTVWWGEGDEKIYVDGETFPSHFGTGTEDYYGYAWGNWSFFEAPFHAQPRCDGPIVLGHTTLLRSRSLDAIPFTKSFKFDIEVWHWKNVDMDYAATTWFYTRPGATHNRMADRDKDKLFVTETKVSHKIEGACEGEEMQVVSLPENINWEPQGNWWDTTWSGDAQVWFGVRNVGDAVELRCPNAVSPGKYKLLLYATRYPDYSIIQMSYEGRKLGEQIDLYNPKDGMAPTGPIDMGIIEVSSEYPVFKFEVVGSNPKAPKPGTYFGFDCLVFEPVK